MKVIACIEDPVVARKILNHLAAANDDATSNRRCNGETVFGASSQQLTMCSIKAQNACSESV